MGKKGDDMSSNKSVKEELIRRYGAECFIEKLHLRKDVKPRTYKGEKQMKRMKMLTYHHIKMKKHGGKATVENGALLSCENHAWFHQQSEEAQSWMNNLFQEYKMQVDGCRVVLVEDLQLPCKVVTTELRVEDVTRTKYDRAREMKEFNKIYQEYVDR